MDLFDTYTAKAEKRRRLRAKPREVNITSGIVKNNIKVDITE